MNEKTVPFWKCFDCGWVTKPMELIEMGDAYCPQCGNQSFDVYDPLNQKIYNPLDNWLKKK